MKWENNRQSDQIEDRRASGGGMFGGGGAPRRVGGRGVGLGTIAIALVAGWIFGINPMTILGALSGGDLSPSAQVPFARSFCRACCAVKTCFPLLRDRLRSTTPCMRPASPSSSRSSATCHT